MKKLNSFKLARLIGSLNFIWNEWFLAKPIVILVIVVIGTWAVDFVYLQVKKPSPTKSKIEKTTTNTKTVKSQEKPGGAESVKVITTTEIQKKEPDKSEITRIETTKTETTIKEQNKTKVKTSEISKTESDKTETLKPEAGKKPKGNAPAPKDEKDETLLFSFWKIVGLYVLLLFFWWGFKSRKQLVVEEFTIFTHDPPDKKERKNLQGLGALLAVELDRLKRLYRTVDEQRAVSTATGVGRPLEVSFKGEDVSSLLKGAVSSDSKLALGPLTIPAGSIMAILSLIFQGPRLSGSLHVEEVGASGERYTLAAQLVGGDNPLSWDVAKEIPKPPKDEVPTFIYGLMVAELAYRIFTDLALSPNTVRWEATRAFSQGLLAYRDCLRTSKDSTLNLKRAEHHLMEAISIDEKMDLAYYNLGVVYTELRRREAAAAAFTKALDLNKGRWEAAYGLARGYFEKIRGEDFQENFREMLKCCERVRELKPDDARVLNLIGSAYYFKARQGKRNSVTGPASASRKSILDDFYSSIIYFEQAADLAWKSFLKEVRGGELAAPAAQHTLRRQQGTLISCLHNLAFGYVELAKLTADNDEKMAKCRAAEKPLKDAFYLQTSPYTSPKLRTESFLAHIYNAQGRIYLESRQYAQAFDYFEKASRIDPNEAFLWACQAAARALENISDQTIGVFCNKFLDCLGVSETIRRRASGSIKELINEYGLHNNNHLQRLAGIGSFLEELKKEEDNAQYLENKYQDLKHFKDKSWECAQVAIKLGKLHLNNQNPVEAAKYFQAALEKLQGEFPQEIRRQELRTWLAQCRRARHEQPQEEINMLENLKALEDIKQALVMNPLSSSLRKELGCTYFCLCRFAEARDALEDALFWGANDPEIYHYLGRSYFHLVQTSHDFPQRTAGLEKAGEYLRNALALYNPEKTTGPGEMKESQQISQTHYWLGQVSLELNRPEPAITSLMIAGNLQDALQEEAPLVDLELSALEQGGIAEASLEQLAPEPACPRTMTSATLSRDEKTLPDTQFWLGVAFLKNKNFNAAENLFQELIQKYGSQAGKLEFLIKARLYYAFSLAERRGNSLTALQYLKEAHDELAALPQPLQQKLLAFYNECEGWIYYKRDKKQDINKSIISLEKAVSLWAEAGSYYRLALAYESGLEETQLEPDMDVSRKRLLRKKAQECCQHVAELDFRREYKEALEDLRNRLKPPETEETSEKSQ